MKDRNHGLTDGTTNVVTTAVIRGRSTVAVAGTLGFQACDDKVCFVPESVPVSWTVTVK